MKLVPAKNAQAAAVADVLTVVVAAAAEAVVVAVAEAGVEVAADVVIPAINRSKVS
jgi:hypothetical protein